MEFRLVGVQQQLQDLPERLPPDSFSKGKVVTITVCGKGAASVSTLQFEEAERSSRIASDVKKLVQHFTRMLAESGAAAPDCPIAESYVLQHTRSTLTLKALDDSKEVLLTRTLIVGPEEHIYLSLDLPVSSRKVLKYDSDSGTLIPKEDSPQFFLGINYQIGDLLNSEFEDGEPSRAADYTLARVSVKALLQASSKPLDSFGLALGYKFPPLKKVNLSALSVFVGRFWTKEDALVDGVVVKNKSYHQSWRVGVSFDLDQAMKWLD